MPSPDGGTDGGENDGLGHPFSLFAGLRHPAGAGRPRRLWRRGRRAGRSPQPQQTGEAEGFAAYEVPSGGFTISIPEEWKATSIDEVLDEGALEELREEDPALADQVERFAQPGSPVKFVRLDLDAQDDFATNVNVYVEDMLAGVSA